MKSKTRRQEGFAFFYVRLLWPQSPRGGVKSLAFEILAKECQIMFGAGAKFDNFLKVVKF